MQPSQRTNHNNSHRQSVPQTDESRIAIIPRHGGAKGFAGLAVRVELGDKHVGRVRDHGAQDTGDVATDEGHGGLGALAVVALLARHAVIDHLDDGLEGGKFHLFQGPSSFSSQSPLCNGGIKNPVGERKDSMRVCYLHEGWKGGSRILLRLCTYHSVGDLAPPEGVKTLIETADTFRCADLPQTIHHAGVRRGNRGLHPDLDSLEGTQGDIGEELSRRGGRQIEERFVLVSVLRAGEVGICLLEVFIPTVL